MHLRPPASRRRAWLAAALALIGLAVAAPSAHAQGGVWTPIPVPGGGVLATADGDSGRVLIAGSNGAFRYDGIRSPARLPIFSGTSDSLLGKAILGARNGDVWFGTFSGAFRLRPDGSVIKYDATSGLGNSSDSEVTCLAEEASGAIWAGTAGGGVSRFDGTTWTTVTTDQGLPSPSVAAIAVDPVDQSLWVGTLGIVSGLAHVVGGAVVQVYNQFSLTPNRNVRSVIATPSGRVWFGTDAGIGRIEGGALTEFSTSGSAISALAEGANGEI
jgi:ligand-binding sensor domain-containing protein